MQDWMLEIGGDPIPLPMSPDAWTGGAEGSGALIGDHLTKPSPVLSFEPPVHHTTPFSSEEVAWMFGDDTFLSGSSMTPASGETAERAVPAAIDDGLADGVEPVFVPPMDEEEDPPYELEDVVVVGRNPNQNGGGPPPLPPPPPPPPPVDPTGPGDGGYQEPVARETPCVETEFSSGADLAKVNNAALAASNAIAASNYKEYEYSSIVWVLNGNVGWTLPYTDNFPDQVNLLGGLRSVPAGATIVGIVHNHPDDEGEDGIPSFSGPINDWESYEKLVSFGVGNSVLGRGVHVDQNLLLYILTDEDDHTRVYDGTDKNTQRVSCTID